MKAVQLKFGGDHHDAVVNLSSKPEPLSDEIVVQVNKYLALGTDDFLHSLKAPLYLGCHYTGVVVSVGADVTDLIATGSGVLGFLRYEPSLQQIQGALLPEYITVKRQDCAVKPANELEQAAASVSGTTESSLSALQALRDDYGGHLVGKGQFVLINGSAGGCWKCHHSNFQIRGRSLDGSMLYQRYRSSQIMLSE